jgi:hypothetical protein
MKRSRIFVLALGLAAVAGLGLSGCDDDSPTAPDNPNLILFRVTMNTANEVPPLSNAAEAAATGTATITFNVTRDGSNNITGGTADFQFSLANFPAGAVARAAHIHPGAAGTAGGVLVDTGLSPAAPINMPNGVGSFTATGVNVPATDLNNIINNPAGFYFNVHTVLNPGGAVRGQLVRQQ